MRFGDYAPPSSPSLDQQCDALRKGLGRAMQWAMSGRLDDAPLLMACRENQVFDTQCEDSRGEWLWRLMQAIGATVRFREPILHALHEFSDERNSIQLCELAKMYGKALGNFALRKICHGVAESERSRSMRSGSMALKPAMLVTSTGKNVSRQTIATFEPTPKPSHITMIGATATLGRLWKPAT